jgi:hypothetical protein
MKPPAGVTINNTLARGLVRHEAHASTEQMQRLVDSRARYTGRFGAQVRQIRADIARTHTIIFEESTGSSRWTWLSLITELDGGLYATVTSIHKRQGIQVLETPYGVTTHCRERMLQQDIEVSAVASLIRDLYMFGQKDRSASLSGWLATEDALWRVNDGMLATVIAADRLDKQRPRWERMRKTANSSRSVFDPDLVPGEQVAT